MRSLWALCVLLALTQCRGAEKEENEVRGEGKVVETQQGPVKGYLSKEGNYFEFFGIPYATAPKGDKKFKAPLEPPSWTDVLEATNSKIACHQPILPNMKFFDFITQTEDCLVVNVFVPRTNKKDLSVIVYVHGGAFFGGAGNMANHEPLIRHDVIVVNMNYRLNVYGFLCLGTKDIPGNAGLKDQVAALRWVKRNIANFGGNPDAVTIGGYSAGSASVEHLMLSPMAKGLFSKVIAESGSALSAWAITPDPIAMAKRYMYDITGTTSDDIFEIEIFYKGLTNEQLTEKFYMIEPDTTFGFVPCVETRIEGEESFYNESPLEILKSGDYSKVPFMPGFGREEGLFRIDIFDQWAGRMEENFADFLPQDLAFRDENEKRTVAEKVKRFYFKDAVINTDKLKEYVDYFTDVMFGYSIARSAMLHARNSVPVYLYDFAYIGSVQMPYSHSDKIKGAPHVAQCAFLHKNKHFQPSHDNFSRDDILLRDRLTKMWTDFAKLGNPVTATSDLLPVAWKPVDPDKLNYLHMNLEFEAKYSILGDRFKFWEVIYEQYYREPVSPDTPRVHSEL